MFPNLIKYVTHTEPTLPPITALAYEYVIASNGIFLRAENRFVKALVPIVEAPLGTVRGLHALDTSIARQVPPMPISLLDDLLADARQMRSCSGQLNEVLYRFHYDGQNVRRAGIAAPRSWLHMAAPAPLAAMPVRVNRPSQDTSPTSVEAMGDGGADVILELHSHGNMRAFWSETDNRDEQGFRFYGVIGRLDSNAPQIRLRATRSVANTRGSLRISLPYHPRYVIYRHKQFTVHRFRERKAVMNKKKSTEGLNMALNLLKNTTPPLNKRKEHQLAVAALEGIKEWAAGAVAQINALQEEVARTHHLLDSVGVGHAEWNLSSRVVLMSFWMQNTPANARLLAALEVVEPHFTKIAENLNQQVAQHGYSDGYDAEQANWLNYVANELQTLAKWQSPPPNVPQKALVKIRVTGPVQILESPDWIKIELVGRQANHT